MLFFKFGFLWPILLFLVILLLQLLSWWTDVSLESSSGDYSPLILDGLKLGIVLFILSEVCFFAGFFWTFFHSSFVPTSELGSAWPPVSLSAFNPFGGPLLNTLILLSSGVSVTYSHHLLISNSPFTLGLCLTILLGIYFTILQFLEYSVSSFSISDSVFGSTFFIATGFHGIHVIVGSLFLAVCLLRSFNFVFTAFHHLGFEMAIWYWHFVDVVWLFLFRFVYWWGY